MKQTIQEQSKNNWVNAKYQLLDDLECVICVADSFEDILYAWDSNPDVRKMIYCTYRNLVIIPERG